MIYEKIKKLPLWKAIILLFFAGFIFMTVIENLVVSKIFLFIDGMITQFDKESKKEQKEWDEDEKASEAFNKKWHDDFKAESDRMEKEFRQSQLETFCKELKEVELADNQLRKMKNPDYKKANDPVIQVWEEQELTELEEGAPERKKRLEDAKEMVIKYGGSEKICDEIKK